MEVSCLSYLRGASGVALGGVWSEPGAQGNFPEIKSWVLLLLTFRIFLSLYGEQVSQNANQTKMNLLPLFIYF